LLASDERIKLKVNLALAVHPALPFQADRVAAEVDAVESQVVAFDAEVDVAVGERGAVGSLNAEELEQRDHGRQLIEVRLTQSYHAVPIPGVLALCIAGHVSQDIHLAARSWLMGSKLAS